MTFLLFSLLLTAHSASATPEPGAAPMSMTDTVIGKFRNTYYYSVQESDYADHARSVTIMDLNDNVIATVSTSFKKNLDIEGSGKLLDGRVVNYAGIKKKEIRYHVTTHPHGRGVGNCPLVPFHSVAVDPSTIPLGSVVQIDETIGMLLPDGSVHDGFWRAEDVGGAIKKDRIDLFIGDGDQGSVLYKAGISTLKALTVRLVTEPAADSCIHQAPQ